KGINEVEKMPIDLNAAAQKYAQVTPAAAPRWQQRATAAAQVWEQNAKSPQAEQYWAQRVMEAAQNQARLRGLQNVTASHYAQGVQAGTQAYQQKVSQVGATKWQQKFAPYANVIDSVVSSLPPKTTDVTQNVMNRVVPIAQALRQAKVGGVAATGPAPAPGFTPGVGFGPGLGTTPTSPFRR
ncbi:MAG: hypothetical protein DRO95_03155, partial [Candidatus Altiarchaeales archaeon]